MLLFSETLTNLAQRFLGTVVCVFLFAGTAMANEPLMSVKTDSPVFKFPDTCFEEWDGYWHSAKACVVDAYAKNLKRVEFVSGAQSENDRVLLQCSSKFNRQNEIEKLNFWECRFEGMRVFLADQAQRVSR